MMIDIFFVFFYIHYIEVFNIINFILYIYIIILFIFINIINIIILIIILGISLQDEVYTRIAITAMTIGKNLGFDLEEIRALCLQLNLYKESGKEDSADSPFKFPIEYAFDDPINWWELISTNPQPRSLPLVALHLFSICPNSASCERGFSNLGWLTNKRRLQLRIETLESICKMITYWKSNPRKELSFFGQKTQKSSLEDVELNQIITKALAEPDDNIDDENDFQYEDNNSLVRRTTDGEIIPDNVVTVLIENIWIEKNIKLTDKLILEDIGEIPEDNNDLVDELTDNENEENGYDRQNV